MTSIVVFDVGGVLVPEGNRMQRLLEFVTATMGEFNRDSFIAAYWAHRNKYDLGCSDEEFWTPVLTAAGFDPTNVTGSIPAVAVRDADLNSTITPEAETLLLDLHENGVPLAILSNAPAQMAAAVESREWASYFTVLGFSSHTGVMKPAEEAYARLEELWSETVGSPISGEEIHFFDDRDVNVEGARSHGWSAHCWTTMDAARDILARQNIVPLPSHLEKRHV